MNTQKLEDFYTKIDELKLQQTELIKLAQVGQQEKKHTLRNNEVTEEMMWYEVYNLGADCEAGKILRKEYPDVFTVVDELNSLSLELKKYLKEEIGVDSDRMTVLDIVKIVKSVNGNT